MTLADSSFPSSTAFDAISQALSTDSAKQEALKSGGGAIFAFTLTNPSGATESWYIDLKKSVAVGKGTAPDGHQPDVTLLFKDEDFGKLVAGKAQAQKLFMSGAMKVKGDLMKATKAEVVLKHARQSTEAPKAKL
ncbi:sterol-binding-like protein [Terfezia boudieri ATCC MYA-4762]|uniref:Sterol-binding-like protein n=1 Tax=Terfezia boudieri ATCC MYA-4762 TaxID=1051890 RepID=A0A3N4LTU2_9PEZI|nr:sterol-binding-like protein [Terfezia boudieri ATCC MYA-4762]